jgi:hypothetical protein
MPQGQQQAPQMNNPRLNAAMDVVTSDAEEQILDPRTLAMLKYKDALQAMQAADQMMAASQPQPMPPTVAERTKLAAEQGIAGLASRLSPGIQRQGNNMQAQQMQQAMSGGLPQLSAPNMARMAGGGIVAFQEGGATGGDVEDEVVMYDGQGNPIYASQLENLAPSKTTPLRDTPSLSEVLRSLGSGVRMGKDIVTAPFKGATEAGQYGPNLSDIAGAVAAGYRGEEAVDIPGLFERRPPETSAVEQPNAQTNAMPTPTTERTPTYSVTDQNFRMTGVDQEQPMSDVDRLLAQLGTEAEGPTPRGTTAAPDSGLASLRAKTDVIRDRNLDPAFVEDTRRGVEDRARDAYAVPEELKALYQSRIDALNKPMFTPEEERSREINALLSGLASSNLIAQGGPAASRAVAEVSDAIRADSTARAEQQFELASSLMDMDRQAAQQAFSAGLDATTTAMNQQGVALQMAISQLNTADNNEAAAIADSAARRVEYIQMSIEAAQKGQSNAAEVQRNLSAMIRSNNDDIANLLATGFPGQPPSAEVLTAINAIRNINATLQSAFNAASSSAGFPIPEVRGDTGGGGGGVQDMSNDDLLRSLGN